MTEGAWIESFCEWSIWPLCSSTRATPLKIMTTARLSVHTLMGSKEVFRTKTLPFILGLILRERGRECQKDVGLSRKGAKRRRQDAKADPAGFASSFASLRENTHKLLTRSGDC
jgi:hypothetical protein